MEIETDIPPPPYSETDPQTPALTHDSSSMGGGDQSPTSTLRPTSSQSMRAASFITLRGGYLRGVPFSDDPATSNYFQERAFEYNPERQLYVLHREITAETTRDDLKYPTFDRDRDVSEQDWQTFVNYVLTELGNEISAVRQRKKLSPEDFYNRQSKIEQLIAEWNEAFFQPRSIKIIAHYYYTHPENPVQAQSANQTELASGLRRINIEDGPMDIPHVQDHTDPSNTRFVWPLHHHGSFGRGGPSLQHGPFGRGTHHPGFGFGRGFNAAHHGHSFGHRQGLHHERGRSHDSGRGRGRGRGRNRRDSRSSESSSSSDSDSESEHGHGSRQGERRVRREHRNRDRHRRSESTSSESSISSVSSISSKDLDEPTMQSAREAVSHFRLDPNNFPHSKAMYRQLQQQISSHKEQALLNRALIPQETRSVSKAQRKALRDELRHLRMELKSISRTFKQAKKTARREAKAARSQARAIRSQAKKDRKQARKLEKAEKSRVKAARKAGNPISPVIGEQTPAFGANRSLSVDQASINTPAPPYDMPGTFPETHTNNEYAEQAVQTELQLVQWRNSLQYLYDVAKEETQHITNAEKKELALAPYKKEISEVQQEINILEAQLADLQRLAGISPSSKGTRQAETAAAGPSRVNSAQSPRDGVARSGARVEDYGQQLGRRIEGWGERFGRDMEAWGEHFGREMERWGTELGRNVSERGNRLGRGWTR